MPEKNRRAKKGQEAKQPVTKGPDLKMSGPEVPVKFLIAFLIV
jgi:hypothetical protein